MGPKASQIKYFDGSTYEGAVNAEGKEDGQGKITYVNGDNLKGTFEDGDCTYAIIHKKKTGDTYDGHMKDFKYHGRGKLTTQKYKQVGLFRDNRFVHGKINFSDGSSYEGAIENGHKSGKGTFITKDGTRLEGYFRNDKLEGHGQVKSKDGTIYNGEFKEGNYHGRGHLQQIEGGSTALDYNG